MMLLGEPQRTQFDINVRLLGIPVRITPWFWLGTLVLGSNITRGNPKLVLLWAIAVLLSITVHEFGHALAFRYFGISSHIVLYHFGGLAVPDGMYSAYGRRSLHPLSQIVVSAAGPAAQLFFAAVIGAIVYGTRHMVPFEMSIFTDLWPIGRQYPMIEGDTLRIFVAFLMLPSVLWALLNLLPVYPLDGGQIARETITLFDPVQGIKYSLMLSIAAGAAIALYGFTHGDQFLGIMFALLAYSSFTVLQAYHGRGGGFGRW